MSTARPSTRTTTANSPSRPTPAGRFAFANLPAGTYRVRRVIDAGYVASHATAEVTLAAGQTKSGLALGAWRA